MSAARFPVGTRVCFTSVDGHAGVAPLPDGEAVMIRARLTIDADTRLSRWVIPGRISIGSWHGPAPRGAVMLPMGMLDLHTGEYRLFGPLRRLP